MRHESVMSQVIRQETDGAVSPLVPLWLSLLIFRSGPAVFIVATFKPMYLVCQELSQLLRCLQALFGLQNLIGLTTSHNTS